MSVSESSEQDGATGGTLGQPTERIVVVGCGFAGYFAVRRMARKLGHRASITVISDTDGMVYQPLLPDVAAGVLDPRVVVVPLATSLKRVRLVRGRATGVDIDRHEVQVVDSNGHELSIGYDRLVLTPGGVTRMFDIPGLADHALGFKTPVQALYLRDLLLRRMEQANAEPDAERRADMLNFIVVGAGYSGTELIAQLSRMSLRLVRRFAGLRASDLRWLLVDAAKVVMPELGTRLGSNAIKVLESRNIDIRLDTSIKQVTDDKVTLTDGTDVDRAALIWCAGVAPSPLIASMNLPTTKGRLDVGTDLRVSDHPRIYALGDAAAVPNTAVPKGADGKYPVCPPTAQHAMRQARVVAHNVVADVLGRERSQYRHKDLGMVADLGGWHAVANPLGISLSGALAKIVTRGYHVLVLPSVKRRVRVALGWLLAGRASDDVAIGFEPMRAALAIDEHRPAQH